MIYYTINHFVTNGDEPMESIVHSYDSLAVWTDFDHTLVQPEGVLALHTVSE